MPDEYDAFGRKVGEDPLGGLGWQSGAPTPTGEPAPSIEIDTSGATVAHVDPIPHTHTAPRSAPSPQLGGGRPRIVGRLVAAAIVAAIGIGAWQAIDAGTDKVRQVVDEVQRAIPDAQAGPGASEEDSGTPRPSRPASLLDRPALSAAIRRLQADVPGRLRNFRLEASRIDVLVYLKGGRQRSAQIQAGAQAAQIFTTTPGGFPAIGLFRYEDVDPAAPGRLIRAAGERLDRGPKKVNYLVFSRFGESLQWGVYYKDGAIAIGDARGRFQRRIS
jgi:hypothetical protein